MADSFGSILKFALVGGAVYVGWNFYQNYLASQAAAAGAGAGSGAGAGAGTPPATPPPPPTAYVPPTLSQALQTLVSTDGTYTANAGKLNADQWNYFYAKVRPSNPLPDAVFTELFFPSGRPADPSQDPLFDLPTFVSAVGSKGFSGVRRNYLPAGLAMGRRSNYVRRWA